MKKLVFVFLLFAATLVGTADTAGATDRIGVTLNDGNLYVKDGAANGPWHQQTSGVSIGGFSLNGDRIALLDQGTSMKTVSVKEPAWNSPFNATYFTDGSQPAATKALVSKLSDGQYRLLVLRADGSVVMKDGPWNTAWWSGTLQPSSGTVSDIVIGGDRIGVIMSNGDFEVKQLTPGQFSHPNNTPWQTVANNVTSASMTNNRIAIVTEGAVIVKDGDINAQWYQNIVISYASKVEVAGDRICAIKNPGWSGQINIECKEGGLTSLPVQVNQNSPSDFSLNATRVLVLRTSGVAELLEGSFNGPNSGWQTITTGATGVELN
jgi:hypothetical protein